MTKESVKKSIEEDFGNLIIKADYSPIELRLMAKPSGDRRMIEALTDYFRQQYLRAYLPQLARYRTCQEF